MGVEVIFGFIADVAKIVLAAKFVVTVTVAVAKFIGSNKK